MSSTYAVTQDDVERSSNTVEKSSVSNPESFRCIHCDLDVEVCFR